MITHISVFTITENYLNLIEQINGIQKYTLIERNKFYNDFYQNKSKKFEKIILQIILLVKNCQTKNEIFTNIKNNKYYDLFFFNDILENKIKEIITYIYFLLQKIKQEIKQDTKQEIKQNTEQEIKQNTEQEIKQEININ